MSKLSYYYYYILKRRAGFPAGRGSHLLQRSVSMRRLAGVLDRHRLPSVQITEQQHQHHQGGHTHTHTHTHTHFTEHTGSLIPATVIDRVHGGHEDHDEAHSSLSPSSSSSSSRSGVQTTQGPPLGPPAVLLRGLLPPLRLLQQFLGCRRCPQPAGVQIPSHPETRVG